MRPGPATGSAGSCGCAGPWPITAPPPRGGLRATARLVALPAGHVDHLGPDWVRQHQLGGALDLGTGVLDPDDRPGVVLPLPPGIAAAAGVDPQEWWPHLFAHAERMGRLAMTRLSRDAASVLRPVGGCDVLALLSSPSLRGHLATGDGSGMRSVAVPIRSRGWFDLRRVDPAFVAAAWTATPSPTAASPGPCWSPRTRWRSPATAGASGPRWTTARAAWR
jgi:hypothetical protein